ncbi:S-adenosylmethionine-dependent methyltransferase [Quillaja saponaria]|uniref:S-adenosylmethionine-dependent methyltransferase n=1 Tax=Quillaja saponaria TaxID=32244 RepID=A0AAD7VGT4_QUISA|nr:S-adenosylmethionine-dependent methyltransferase [Quillaja saponaria]
MEEEMIDSFSEAYTMNSGDGYCSYSKNSSIQKDAIFSAKELITQTIVEKLDIKNFSFNIFRIADLGCSVGPNTFFAVQNIMEAVKSKQYYAAGVPGSFYNKLFPNSLLHIIHSSYSIHWISKVPTEVVSKSSSAWNKGKIHYSSAPDAVTKAYAAQYQKDMDRFLCYRAQEIVQGGLLVLIAPARPNGTSHSQTALNMCFDALGSCLLDMVNKGVVDEEKLDSFNIPIYVMSLEELAEAVDRNGYFTIEEIREQLPQSAKSDVILPWTTVSLLCRATLEDPVKAHFGGEIVEELFDLYMKKLEELSSILRSGKAVDLLS